MCSSKLQVSQDLTEGQTCGVVSIDIKQDLRAIKRTQWNKYSGKLRLTSDKVKFSLHILSTS